MLVTNPLIPSLLSTLDVARTRGLELEETRELLRVAVDIIRDQAATIDRQRAQLQTRFWDDTARQEDDNTPDFEAQV